MGAGRGLGRGLGDGDQDQGDEGHRYVDPEDRPPGPLGQVATEQRADGREPAGDAEEQGQRLASLVQREGLHHDGQGGREHDRPAGPLDGPEGDDPGLGGGALGGQTAHGRGGGEHDHAEHHHPAVSDGVGQPATEGEEGGQRQEIGVDRPLHPGVASGPSSRWIWGTAMETMVWSMKVMATAKIIAASTRFLDCPPARPEMPTNPPQLRRDCTLPAPILPRAAPPGWEHPPRRRPVGVDTEP